MWLLNACLRLKPLAVFLKRLEAPLCILAFAILDLRLRDGEFENS
jgi:hypothetical protein